MRRDARPSEHPPQAIRPHRLLRIGGVALLALTIAIAGFAIGLRAGSSQQPDHDGDLNALLNRSATTVVYSEFGQDADTIWAANPLEPGDRVALGSAPHLANYAIRPSLSPDTKYVAYTAAGANNADLWLLDVSSGSAQRIAENVDLQNPVWAGNEAIVVRRSGGDDSAPTSELRRIDPAGGSTLLASAAGGLYPIGAASDAVYYASLDPSGTDLHVADAAGTKVIAHLSDGIARDWTLSPDAKQLAYLAPRAAGGFAVNVLDVETGESGDVASANTPAFNPVWAPNGSLTVGGLGAQLDGQGIAGASSSGFDVPLSWAPDGSTLIVRHFEGTSTSDPGPSWLWAIASDGQRRRLSDLSDVAIAGWLEATP